MKIVQYDEIPENQEQLKEWLKKLLNEFQRGKISSREFLEKVNAWLIDTPVEKHDDFEIYYEEDMTTLDKLWDLVVVKHHGITWKQKIPKMIELIEQL